MTFEIAGRVQEDTEWSAKQAAFDHMREQVAETQARFDAMHPRHYAGTECTCAEAVQSMVECWPETDRMVLYWCMSAFKYLWRWPHKGGTQDLRKAVTCLNYAIGRLED